jgi:flagellar hook-associated protein 1
MTIQGAFLSALTSLSAQQAETNVISNNIANSSTAGYSAREVSLTEIVYGGTGQGVSNGPVQRASDGALTAAANQASSAASYSQAMTDGLTKYTAALAATTSSSSDDEDSVADPLSAAMSGLQTALTSLSANPSDATTQVSAVSAAQSLVGTFHTLSADVSTAREQADANVATGVAQVNSDLNALATNETALKKAAALGESTAAFQDKRDSLVADMSQYVPVQTLDNSDGSVTVMTDGGTTLYDGSVHALSFTSTPTITSASGSLPGVTVDGRALATSQNGSIAANLQLRDGTLATFGNQLDQLAANVVGAFQKADPTVSTSNPTGLFTGAGGAAVDTTDPSQVAGLAAHIAVNAAVDPDQGGDAALVQTGLHATGTTGATDATVVNDLIAGMSAAGSYTSPSGVTGSPALVTAAAQVASLQQGEATTWSGRNDTRSAQSQDAQTALSNATGVNVDQEMQRLLLVQQTYAASAQVIQAAAQMLSTMNSVAGTAVG